MECRCSPAATMMQSGVAGLAVGLRPVGLRRRRRVQRAAAAAAPRRRPAPSRSAPTTPTRCPRARSRRCFDQLPDRLGHQGRRQHGRPQHVPGADQQLPAGHARRRRSPGSPATACSSSPARAWRPTSTTSGRRSAATSPTRFKKASTGLDGKQYFIPFYNYPWAIFYRKSVFEKNGYEPAANLDELQGALRADEEGRPDPDRVRRQGRLAGDGHVRHINMRINGYDFHMQPDGRRGVLDGPEGQGRLRRPGASCSRYHAEGSLGRTWQDAAQTLEQEVRHVPARLVRRPAVRGRGARGPRLLPVPGDQLRARPGRGRGADRRLHALQGPEERGGARRRCWSTSPRPRRRTPTSRATRTTSPPTTRRTRATTTRCRRRRSS